MVALATLFCAAGLTGILHAPFVATIAIPAATAGAAAAAGAIRGGARPGPPALAGFALGAGSLLPLFLLALYPAAAWDEMGYHLPTVRRFAETGSLPFVAQIRFPVFPHAAEVLQTSLFLFGGETAAHLVALFATAITAMLLWRWGAMVAGETGAVIALALFLASPLIIDLGSSGYVEAVTALFVTAAVYSFARWDAARTTNWLVLAGIFAGAGTATKYLGVPIALGLLVALAVRSRGPRAALLFAASAACVALPWYARIVAYTGNPFFPFLPSLFGSTIWDGLNEAHTLPERLRSFVRLPWDLLFRPRSFPAQPLAPWFSLSLPLLAFAAWRDRMAAAILAACTAWALLFQWMPRDSRFLTPLLPLMVIGVTRAIAVTARRRVSAGAAVAVAVLLMVPGLHFAAQRLLAFGAIPADTAARDLWLRRYVRGYPAVAFLNEHAGARDRAFSCGNEENASHFKGTMMGDLTGPARFDRVITARDARDLTMRLRPLGVRWVVQSGQCHIAALTAPDAPNHFRRRYFDGRSAVYELTQ